MFWTIVLVILLLWLLGFAVVPFGGDAIHILLVILVVLIILKLAKRL